MFCEFELTMKLSVSRTSADAVWAIIASAVAPIRRGNEFFILNEFFIGNNRSAGVGSS